MCDVIHAHISTIMIMHCVLMASFMVTVYNE